MELPVTGIRRLGEERFVGEKHKFTFDYVKFDMPIRYPVEMSDKQFGT